jgi:peroxiredoxin
MSRLSLGDPVPAFELPGVDGETHSPGDFDGQPVAIVFSCCHCPYVIAWEARLDAITRDYEGRAGLLAVNSNDHIGDSFDDMKARAEEQGFAYPFLRDDSQDVAQAYGASRTPEVFLFDSSHRLAYHGAPDSNHAEPENAEPWLRDALDAVLEGRTPDPAETPPVGCTVKWRA